jgi:hypothetical protein
MIEMFSILVVVVFFIKASIGIIKETKVFEFVVNSKVLFLGRTFLGSTGSFLSFGFGMSNSLKSGSHSSSSSTLSHSSTSSTPSSSSSSSSPFLDEALAPFFGVTSSSISSSSSSSSSFLAGT